MGVSWTFTTIAIIAVLLRLYVVPRKTKHGLSWDDWLMFAAMVRSITYATTKPKVQVKSDT